MASEHWKKDKVCPICGITFQGTAKAQMCGSTCRTRLKRLLAIGGKPQFYLIAKSKGQKVPELDRPEKLRFRKPEPKQKEEVLETKIEYVTTTPESYDAPRLSNLIMDEVGQTAPPPTKEEALQIISDLEKKKEIISKRNVLGGSPKANALQKAMEIDAINDQIDNIKKLLI